MTASRQQAVRRDEEILVRSALVELSGPGVWLARNHVGNGFYGALKHQLCSSCRAMSNSFRVSYGLGEGSPDVFGVARGAAFAIEFKSDVGRLEPSQRTFIASIERNGCGLTLGEARSVEQARAIIDRAAARAGATS